MYFGAEKTALIKNQLNPKKKTNGSVLYDQLLILRKLVDFCETLFNDKQISGLHVLKKRFILAVLFQKFFYFLLTQSEKRLSANETPLFLRRSAKKKESLFRDM